MRCIDARPPTCTPAARASGALCLGVLTGSIWAPRIDVRARRWDLLPEKPGARRRSVRSSPHSPLRPANTTRTASCSLVMVADQTVRRGGGEPSWTDTLSSAAAGHSHVATAPIYWPCQVPVAPYPPLCVVRIERLGRHSKVEVGCVEVPSLGEASERDHALGVGRLCK